jgi:putative serine protease PepD
MFDEPRRRSIPGRVPMLVVAGTAAALTAGCSATATPRAESAQQLIAAPSTSGSPSLRALQQEYVDVVKQVSPSVVQIETGSGLGSGVVIDRKGDIVTNAHVVSGQRSGPFQQPSGRSTALVVTTSGGRHYKATVVGVAPANDLAVIRVNGASSTPAQFADSSRIKVGDTVLAIGSPLGLQSSVTEGIVSAVNRDVPESRSVDLKGLIQTSAAINPGNSGGALVDLQGNVVGIPTLGATSGNGTAAGIGFAIPSNQVVNVAKQLIG